MFVNADAGDIDPSPDTCSNKPDYKGAPIIANAIADVRAADATAHARQTPCAACF